MGCYFEKVANKLAEVQVQARLKRIRHKMRNGFVLLKINPQHIILAGTECEMMTVLIIGFILTNNIST